MERMKELVEELKVFQKELTEVQKLREEQGEVEKVHLSVPIAPLVAFLLGDRGNFVTLGSPKAKIG